MTPRAPRLDGLAIVSVAVLVLALAVLAAPARGHVLPRPKPLERMTLAELERFQVRSLAHAEGAVRFLERRRDLRHLAGYDRELRFHRAMAGWVARELQETRWNMGLAGVPWPWNAIADCETGDSDGRPPYRARWAYNGPSGFDGGVQFLPSTWTKAAAMVGASRYRYAWQAPPNVQVAVAAAWLRVTDWAQWPACSRKVGLR